MHAPATRGAARPAVSPDLTTTPCVGVGKVGHARATRQAPCENARRHPRHAHPSATPVAIGRGTAFRANRELLTRAVVDARPEPIQIDTSRALSGSASRTQSPSESALSSCAGQMALQLEEATFRDVCGLWLADRSRRCAGRTLIAYEKSARLTLVPALGHLPAGAITRKHVQAMHVEARQLRGPAAANQALAHGRMAWRFAADEGIVGEHGNPFDRHRLFAEPKHRNPISPESALAIWRVCEDVLEGRSDVCHPVHAAYFQLVLVTGLRKREATHLRHDEFRRDRHELVISKHKTSASAGAKVIALSHLGWELMCRLEDRFHWHDTWFFPSPTRSKRGHIEDPLPQWNRVRDAAGVPVGNIHDARRGFATTLDAAGATLKQIGQLLGHTSERTTSNYVQPTIATSRAASELFVASTFGKEVGRG